jgi:pimeloyl-ACP methyl ester carboxylesterase
MVLAGAAVASILAPATVEHAAGEQDVTFASSGVTLAGTLIRPAARGESPGVVLLHGSGPGPRAALETMAERFVADGFTALIFDKRGSGASTGSWTEGSLDDLADDALAAVAFLKSQPGIDVHHVGMWGISQAGWVIPRAVAREPDAAAFIIVITGGGLKPIDVERYDYRAALTRLGTPDDRLGEPLALVDRYMSYLRDGADRAGLERAIENARSQRWFAAVDVSRVLPAAEARAKWQWVADYDPVPDITRLSVPALVVLGGRDRPGLSERWARTWREGLVAAGNRDATIVELLGADHGGVVEGTHHVGGAPQTFVPGYPELVDAWLRTHGR